MNGDSEHCATFYGSVIFFVFQTPTPKTKKAEKGASRFFFKLSSPQSRSHRLLTIYTYTKTVLFISVAGASYIYISTNTIPQTVLLNNIFVLMPIEVLKHVWINILLPYLIKINSGLKYSI